MKDFYEIKIFPRGDCYDVWVNSAEGLRTTGQLTYDETIGALTQLLMPEKRRCLDWLKFPDQRRRNRTLQCRAEDGCDE